VPGHSRLPRLMGRRRIVRTALLVAMGLLAVAACSPGGRTAPPAGAQETFTVVAAGDIACSEGMPQYNGGQGTPRACRQADTAKLVAGLAPDAVLTLGDQQYDEGTEGQFDKAYDSTWGAFKSITHPVPGNHEYLTPHADGYYSYFGERAGDRPTGAYSFDLASWHVVALTGECGQVGGCGMQDPQARWLADDLAKHPDSCVLAFWHEPRWSSNGPSGAPAEGAPGDATETSLGHRGNPSSLAIWQVLYNAGADVVLNGHEHQYERFTPQDPSGAPDPARGVREFVVGTGGRSQYPFAAILPTSEAHFKAFGVLRLTLAPQQYSWTFVPTADSPVSDSGSGTCHHR